MQEVGAVFHLEIRGGIGGGLGGAGGAEGAKVLAGNGRWPSGNVGSRFLEFAPVSTSEDCVKCACPAVQLKQYTI